MMITVFSIAAFCLGVGIAVLSYQPRRWANQVFAAGSVLVAAWLFCIGQAIRAGLMVHLDGTWDPVPWIRANGAIAGFFPWYTYILGEAVCADTERRKALLRSAPLYLVGVVAAIVCFTDWFIPAESTPAAPQRGNGYWATCFASAVLFAGVVFHIVRRMRQQTGLRRVEMLFLSLNLVITFPTVETAMALGNLLRIHFLKDAALAVLLGSYLLSGWALTFHRVYDVRQLLLSLGHRIAIVAVLAGGVWAASSTLHHLLPEPAVLLVGVTVSATLALALDRKSREWIDLTGERHLLRLRHSVIELSRTEPRNEELVLGYNRLLQEHFEATSAALLVEKGPVFVRDTLAIERDSRAFAALIDAGWATLERLDRARFTAENAALAVFMAQHSLALLLTVPRGSPKPSLIIALGPRTNRWPFTYPEVQRVQEVGNLMDNILVRSRLIHEEGLKAKIDHLGMMSRGLAHDLKNLITPISSFLVHTAGRYAPGSAEEEVHNAATRSVAIIREYVNEALFFSRRLTPNFQPVDPAKLLARVVEITQPRAARSAITVTVGPVSGTEFVADFVLVQRLLVNLLNNAIDASAAGSVVTVRQLAAGGTTRLEVADEGSGISPEHRGKIFDPYFTTKQFGDHARGFGLGLTICDKIVALHGGSIAVQSEVGRGTTFVIELPVRQSVASAV